MIIYVRGQLRKIMKSFNYEWHLFRRRLKIKKAKLSKKIRFKKAWAKENIDIVITNILIVLVSAIIGLMVGGFIGFVFVFNALVGA